MSRGFGWVQMACLWRIKKHDEERGELPTTYDIAAYVYQAERTDDGGYWLTDAQHVAVKRALEGLQRKGRIIGFRMKHDERTYRWMSEKRAQQWVRDKNNAGRAERVRAKMRAIGMKAR
jgi:hypothetical protein